MAIIYRDTDDKIDVSLTEAEIIKMLDKPSEDIYPVLLSNKKYKNGLSAHEYLYLCSIHTFKDKNLNIKYSDNKKWLYETLKYVELRSRILKYNNLCKGKLFKIPEEERNYKYDYVPDTSIISAMYNNMNTNYDAIDRIIYYYFKSCYLFQTDIMINYVRSLDEEAERKYKEGYNWLYDTNVSYNFTPCFRIIEILKYFIKKEGALVSEYGINSYGTIKHVNLDLVLGNTAISLDPLTFGGLNDMILVKLNMGHKGIRGFSANINVKDKIEKVYQDVQEEFKDYRNNSKYDEYTMNYLLHIIDKLNIFNQDKENLKLLFNEFNSINLSGIEYQVEIIRTQFDKIIEVFKKRVIPKLVCSNINGNSIDTILCIRQLDGTYMYLRLNDNYAELLREQELTKLVRDNKIVIMLNKSNSSYRILPGINKDIQINAYKKYKKEILPGIYEMLKNGKTNSKENISYVMKNN